MGRGKDEPRRERKTDLSSEDTYIFDLDKNRLDEEWENQPRLYHKYAELLADARADYDYAKAACDDQEAETSLRVRKNPEDYGLDKTTEDVVKKTTEIQKEYRKAKEAVIVAKHKVEKLDAIVRALDHRKRALENLVSLRLANYYAEPVAPKEAREDMRERIRRKQFSGKRRQEE